MKNIQPHLWCRRILESLPAITLLALSCGAYLTLFQKEALQEIFYADWTYYITTLLVFLWGRAILKVWLARGLNIRAVVEENWPGIMLSLALCCLVLITIEPKARIMDDEAKLVSQSQAMFFMKKAVTLYSAEFERGHITSYTTTPAIRPPLFPYMLHLVHIVSGFRFENAFALNSIALFSLLVSVFVLVKKEAGLFFALAALPLVVCQPVVSIYAMTACYDMLFAAFAIVSFLSLRYYMNCRTPAAFELLWANLLMVSYIRRESFIYAMLTIIVLLVLGCVRAGYLRSSTIYPLSPLIVLPLIWQKVFVKAAYSTVPEAQIAENFSLGYFFENNKAFLADMFDFSLYLPYANIVNALGVLAALWLGIVFCVRFKEISRERKIVTAIAAIVYLSHWAIISSFSLVGPKKDTTLRYHILTCVILSVMVVLFFSGFRSQRAKTMFALFVFAAFVTYHPVAMKDSIHKDKEGWIRNYNIMMDFLRTKKDRDFLLIADAPRRYVIHGISSINFNTANRKAKQILADYENHKYKNIYVGQEVYLNTKHPREKYRLNDDYKLQSLFKRQADARVLVNISKAVSGRDT